MKTQSRRSATACLLALAGLFLTVLLAVTLSGFGFAAQAQSPELQGPLEQALRLDALDGRIEGVRTRLDQGAAPDGVDADGRTALMFAAAEGQVEVIKALLSHGADVTIKDNDGDKALDFAVKNGHQAAAGLLRKETE